MTDPELCEGITNQLITENHILARERDELKAKVAELEAAQAQAFAAGVQQGILEERERWGARDQTARDAKKPTP